MRHLLMPVALLAIFFTMLFETGPARAEELTTLINQRLSLMKDVAAYKWIHDLQITDPEREKTVLDEAVMDGLKRSITVESSRRFFTAQIEAAKTIQFCWQQRWRQDGGPTAAPDLNGTLRPRLLKLGLAITNQLAQRRVRKESQGGQIHAACLTDEAKAGLLAALAGVRFYPDRFTQVKDGGILRVGTTGDYAPFSFSKNAKGFEGIDIDLARDLARSLGIRVVFIRTSWPTLMRDMAGNEFDVGMSGISRTREREKVAYFSHTYYLGGKTPITLCRKARSYNALVKIDRPGVRLLVNPGGTNERFIDDNIRHATKIIHRDNRTIFNAILDGKGDLMITDSIEADLQSKRHPDLCRSMPGKTLNHQEKAYLMPKDSMLQATINGWLKSARDSGRLEAVFSRHLR